MRDDQVMTQKTPFKIVYKSSEKHFVEFESFEKFLVTFSKLLFYLEINTARENKWS